MRVRERAGVWFDCNLATLNASSGIEPSHPPVPPQWRLLGAQLTSVCGARTRRPLDLAYSA